MQVNPWRGKRAGGKSRGMPPYRSKVGKWGIVACKAGMAESARLNLHGLVIMSKTWSSLINIL